MKQFDPIIDLIQLKRLIKLEEVIASELNSFENKEIKETIFQEFFKTQYEIILNQSKKCSYNPLVKIQIGLVEEAFDKYQKLYQELLPFIPLSYVSHS